MHCDGHVVVCTQVGRVVVGQIVPESSTSMVVVAIVVRVWITITVRDDKSVVGATLYHVQQLLVKSWNCLVSAARHCVQRRQQHRQVALELVLDTIDRAAIVHVQILAFVFDQSALGQLRANGPTIERASDKCKHEEHHQRSPAAAGTIVVSIMLHFFGGKRAQIFTKMADYYDALAADEATRARMLHRKGAMYQQSSILEEDGASIVRPTTPNGQDLQVVKRKRQEQTSGAVALKMRKRAHQNSQQHENKCRVFAYDPDLNQ